MHNKSSVEVVFSCNKSIDKYQNNNPYDIPLTRYKNDNVFLDTGLDFVRHNMV